VVPSVVPAVRQRFEHLIETLTQGVAQVDAELLEMVKVEPEAQAHEPVEGKGPRTDQIEQKWKAAIALLVSIPGIGLLTACWLVVATLNFPLCESAAAAVHDVGLAPMLRISGTSIRGRAQIGHSGHPRARTQLYVATLAAARFNPAIKPYYERLRAAGKPMKVGSTACARKLLHIAYAVVKHEQAFDPNYQSRPKGSTVLT
jgi:transposase